MTLQNPDDSEFVFKILLTLFFMLGMLVMLIYLSGCTYSINLVHTEGSAQDVVDEMQKADPTASPTLSLPLLQKV